jgi:hypothetical protein
MLSATYVVAFIAATTVPLVQQHAALHGISGGLRLGHAALALFCSINLLICLWELSLFYCRRSIRAHYLSMKQLLPAGRLPSPMFLFEHVSLRDALSLAHWGKVWSTYSLMDPSYSDPSTFGCAAAGQLAHTHAC